MNAPITTLPVTVADSVHRPRPAPDTHLCTCGRLREACVRRTIRALWDGRPR